MAILLVIKNRVTLAECAASGVLSGQANAHASRRQGGKRERFGGRPIERMFAVGHFAAGYQSAFEFCVNVKSGWQPGELVEQGRKCSRFHASARFIGRFGTADIATPDN